MSDTQIEAQRPSRVGVRRIAGIALAALLMTGVILGASLSGAFHRTGVAGASVAVPKVLTGSYVLSLSVPGIPGSGTSLSSTDIAALSYSWGIANPTGSTTPKFSSLNIEKYTDQASPLLQQADALKTGFPTVTLSVEPSSGSGDSEVITLSTCRIVSDQESGSTGGGTESVAFTFAKISYVYTTASGTIITGS
jgi:type VI protein secretion system component Hcp